MKSNTTCFFFHLHDFSCAALFKKETPPKRGLPPTKEVFLNTKTMLAGRSDFTTFAAPHVPHWADEIRRGSIEQWVECQTRIWETRLGFPPLAWKVVGNIGPGTDFQPRLPHIIVLIKWKTRECYKLP